jgi:hypothetical protein
MGAKTAGVLRRAVVGTFTALFGAACGTVNGADDAMPTTASAGGDPTATTLPACGGEERHAVVFDMAGSLAEDAESVDEWLTDEGSPAAPAPGAADLTQAYRSRGYEVLYATTVKTDRTVDGQPVLDALSDWLTTNGFAVGTGTRIFGLDPASPRGDVATLALTDELVRTRSSGTIVDYGYSDNPEKILAFETGGVAPEHMFSLNDGAGTNGSTAIPGDDLVAHRAMVDSLPKVCE